MGPELEFFYFKDSQTTEPLDNYGYYDQLSSQPVSELRWNTVLNLSELGIPVKYSHHEGAPGQQEIDLQYTDALTMADSVMTAKLVIKGQAQLSGAYASFMPKPITGVNGSGMHVHQSLFRGDNAFYDLEDQHHLSLTGKRFIAGLIRHATEISLVTNQWVNTYKRLVSGFEAPVFVCWDHRNRSDLIRVPAYKPGYDSSVRVEYRAPDPACNPYPTFSVLLAAGIKGIEEEYPDPPPVEGNIFGRSSEELEARGIEQLPGTLGQAISLAEKSEFVRQTLGEPTFSSFIWNKKIEWDQYQATVTDYEVRNYLPEL